MRKLLLTLCLSILLAQLQTITTSGDNSRTRGRPQSDRTGDRTVPAQPSTPVADQTTTAVPAATDSGPDSDIAPGTDANVDYSSPKDTAE